MATRRSALSAAFATAVILVIAPPGFAANGLNLTFVTHAAFFSHEMKLSVPVDPQVFVKDTAAKAAKGPQNIHHAAGVRPAQITKDPKSDLLYDAKGKPINLTLGSWLGATGTVKITPAATGAKLSASFSGLVPNGHYSLFENHFDQKPIGFTPMDGAGTENNFIAAKDGTATISLSMPDMPTHANGILVVYHSDGKFHGKVRGVIGVDAHHQLIARP